ncbi:MAG: methyltransferase domain-containing protein [Planctomycetes bacterium]|nr:methyltransferase domain-containing protein [Planctomycetota bacterium]
MQLITGSWASAFLGAGASLKVFGHIEKGKRTAEDLAKVTGTSVRGMKALLDGLTGLGLITVAGGQYTNSPEATAFLVEGKPPYLGAFAKLMIADFATSDWAKLPDAVKAGGSTMPPLPEVEDNPFWHELVPAIAPLAVPSAQAAVGALGFAKAGAASILDVGGGSGAFSAVMLQANPKATATQADWPGVNRIAKGIVASFGVGDRFKTLDGNIHKLDYGTAAWDVVVYSHIAHQESPATNVEIFKKFRRALKPGGSLVVNDFIVNDERGGPPFALMFAMNMMLHTKEGNTYRESDYRAWMKEAGFKEVLIVGTQGPASLAIGR